METGVQKPPVSFHGVPGGERSHPGVSIIFEATPCRISFRAKPKERPPCWGSDP